MCTLVVKQKNGKIPRDIELENCFINNPDGAGIAYHSGNIVHYVKGLMSLDAFFDAYDLIMRKHEKSAMLYHFRIGTHGGNTPENTHPFPISYNFSYMQKLEGSSKYVMAHNGIFHNVPQYKKYSDTMAFNRHVLFPLYRYTPKKYHPDIIEPLLDYSKLAILDNTGNVCMYGDFLDIDHGLFFSNKGYLGHIDCKPTTKKHSAWDDFCNIPEIGSVQGFDAELDSQFDYLMDKE